MGSKPLGAPEACTSSMDHNGIHRDIRKPLAAAHRPLVAAEAVAHTPPAAVQRTGRPDAAAEEHIAPVPAAEHTAQGLAAERMPAAPGPAPVGDSSGTLAHPA